MQINTAHLERSIQTLESSLSLLMKEEAGPIAYEVFRNAVVKGFELTLETSGKLLRKALKAYGATPKSVDELFYKDVLREAGKHGLLDTVAIQRWFRYRDNRHDPDNDDGLAFVEETLKLLPDFIQDAKALEKTLTERFKDEVQVI